MTRLQSSKIAVAFLVFAQIASAANPACAMAMSMNMDMNTDMATAVTQSVTAAETHQPTLFLIQPEFSMPSHTTMATSHSGHKMVVPGLDSQPQHVSDSNSLTTAAHHDNAHNTCATSCDCSLSCASAAALQPASLKVLTNTLVATVEGPNRPRQLSGFSPRHFRPPTAS
jgi:hypothetical protein